MNVLPLNPETTAPAEATDGHPPRIAVLVPCYNEELSVADVVRDMRVALPDAKIYVYDNNSSDQTAARAAAAGAVVRREFRQGKGHVVRRMFADIEADIYLMVDGDGTYDAAAAPRLIAELLSGPYDLVNGVRVHQASGAYRLGHVFGNRMLTGLVTNLFGAQGRDMLSGYKALSRRFVKSFPLRSAGFEIETELLIHAVELGVPMAEVETAYGERPQGSHSKLNTIRDGLRILKLIVHLVRKERPLPFFGALGAVLAAISVVLAVPIFIEFLDTGLVPRFPTLIGAAAVMLGGVLSFFAGLILDTVVALGREQKTIAYLSYPSVLDRENRRTP